MVSCNHCQKYIEDSDKFCRHCGKEVFVSSTKKDKKCPFCAEIIKPDAVFCRYCKQELPAETEHNTKQEQSITHLSMDELMVLFEASSESYKTIPPKITEEVIASSMAISEFMQEVLIEYIRFKLLSDQQIQAYVNQMNGYLMCWNLVCVLIGAEHSSGSISATETSRLVNMINQPFFDYISEYIDILSERKIFNKQKSGRLKTQLTSLTNDVSRRLLDFGVSNYSQIERLDSQKSQTPFLMELKKLISGV